MNGVFEKGTIINNRYIVRALIGQGGMGYVYLVRDTLKAGTEIALKTVRTANNERSRDNNDLLNPFKLEFEIMTRLKHPNLVNVYNFGFDDQKGCYYITMEYLRGITLKKMLSDMPYIDEPKAVDIMVKLLRGLEFIHSRNIVSRDVKPSNIMLSGENVILMDFGISDMGQVEQKRIKGSILYIAPEVLVGEADHRIDIYSAGIVFLQMLTGKILYKETKATSIIDIMKDEYVYLYNQSVALEKLKESRIKDIISRMIAYNKEDRYRSCSEIIHDIGSHLGYDYDIETPETKDAYVTGVNFTGREKEFGWLKEKVFSVSDRSRILILESNTGLGKTKIFNELKKFCQLNNILFCESECLYDSSKPYHPLAQAILQIMLYAPRELNMKFHKYLKKIASQKIYDENSDMTSSLKEELAIMHRALINYMLEYGNSSGFLSVIYLNNIQWIDEGSFEIIHTLLNELSKKENSNNGIRFFASLRSEESAVISDKLRRCKSGKNLDIRVLKPFGMKDIMKYFENIFGSRNLDGSLSSAIGRINDRIGGNPFFLGEFVRYSLKEGIINKPLSKWILTRPVEEINVPCNIRGILAGRLRPFLRDSYHSRFLNVFSLIRFPMSYNNICSFFQCIDREIIRTSLQELENNEILKSEKVGNNILFKISHGLIRDIAGEEIQDKAGMHAFIGSRVEDVFSLELDNYAHELAYHFQNAGNKEKAIHYLRRSGAIQSTRYFNISDILNHYREALRLSMEFYGRKSNETAMVYSDIGYMYYLEGDFSSALKNSRTAEKIIRDISGQSCDNYPPVLNRLCLIYLKTGNYSKAMEHARTALQIMISLHGSRSVPVARIYNSIAQINLKTGDTSQALDYAEKCHEIYLEIYGPDSKEMITPTNLMGIVYLDMAELEKARDNFFKTMKLQTIFYGKDSIEITTSYNNLGLVLLEQACYKEALYYLKKTLKILKAFYKGSHVDIAKCYNNMGIVYHELMETDKAFRYYNMALRIRRKFYGDRHTRTAGSYNNVGIIYAEKGEYKKALKYYMKSLDIQKAIFGRDHSSVAKAMNNIGHLYYKMKDYEQALKYINTAQEIRQRVYAGSHTDMASGYHGLASLYEDLGETDKALGYLEKALDIYRRFYGERHSDIAHSYSAIGDIYETMGDYEKSYSYCMKALEIYRHVFGVKHKKYIEMTENKNRLEGFIKNRQ